MLRQNQRFLKKFKTTKTFQEVFQNSNISNYQYKDALDFFRYFWNLFESYQAQKKVNNNVPGRIFEIIIGFILDYENIEIKSHDEAINGVDFAKPDFVIKKGDAFISCKTSLRERWKQADWESIKYKKKFPNAKCYLITNNYLEFKNLKKHMPKIEIDEIFYADSSDIIKMINKLH